MAKADLGTKRSCMACGMKYYDFNRSPILCPGCGAIFDPENIIKSRKGRISSRASAASGKDLSDQDSSENMELTELSETVLVDNDNDNDDDDDDDDVVDDDLAFEDDDDSNVEGEGPGIIQDDISDGDELLPNLDDKEDV